MKDTRPLCEFCGSRAELGPGITRNHDECHNPPCVFKRTLRRSQALIDSARLAPLAIERGNECNAS